MNVKLTIAGLVTFAFLMVIIPFLPAMATMPVDQTPKDPVKSNCGYLIEDLQVLVENGILSSTDARDVLTIFYCNNIGGV